ncbi:MAG TPA: flagellar biosynthetic protein FlhB [Planctomycetaceae bacterium]|nr:flagellar biosynthetic protein FlhB [Planctomycetaceae bacterium]
MAETGGDKKHAPTEHRRQKAREQGQVARSQDLGSALVLLISVLLLGWSGPPLVEAISDIMRACFLQDYYWHLNSRSASGLFVGALTTLLYRLLPIMVGVIGIVLANNWFQIGFLFLPDKLNLDFKRINPVSGVKKLFDLPNFARLGFGLLKIALVTTVIIFGLWDRWGMIIGSGGLPAGKIGGVVWDTTLDLCMRAAVVLLLLAILDYGFQWWKTEQDLKMTDEEVREEQKMMNGDPQVAGRRRQMQRELAMGRLGSTVPEADVVVTNPTHLALALKFDPDTMPAPMLLAKGEDHLAARIRKLALENDVPVVERKPLARALYDIVEVGDYIPVDQYAAVAEVLRYVYQLKGKEIPSLDGRKAA